MALGRVNVGGGKKLIGDAVESNVLLGKTFSNATGNDKVGTMPNNGAVSHSLAINGSYTIPAGYHSGSGKVTQAVTTKGAQTYTPSTTNQTVPSGRYLTGTQTILGDADLVASNIKATVDIFGVVGTFTADATATAGGILLDSTAYVNGAKVTGTMPNNGATTHSLAINGSFTIPEGYHNGTGVVSQSIATKTAQTYTPTTTAQTIASGQYLSGAQTISGDVNLVSANIKSGATIFGVAGDSNVVDTSAGDASASQILYGKKAYVDGALVTGTMPNNGAVTNSLAINGSYTIPAGYHSGTGKVTQSITTKAAATYTPGTTAQTISAGQYLTGAQTISAVAGLSAGNIKTGAVVGGVTGTYKGYGTAAAANVLSGKTFSTASLASATGTMVNRGAVTNTITTQGGSYTIPSGYHSGSGKVTASFSNLSAGNIKSGVNIGGVVGSYNNSAYVSDSLINFSISSSVYEITSSKRINIEGTASTNNALFILSKNGSYIDITFSSSQPFAYCVHYNSHNDYGTSTYMKLKIDSYNKVAIYNPNRSTITISGADSKTYYYVYIS